MKKTKFLSLVLITSALATCGNTKTAYKTEHKDAGPDNITSIPKHWTSWAISEAELTSSIVYERDSTHRGGSHPAGTTGTNRGGFGHGNAHMNSGS